MDRVDKIQTATHNRVVSLYVILAVCVSVLGATLLFRGESPKIQAAGCPGSDVTITTNTNWTTNQCYGNVVVKSGATLTISGNTSHAVVNLTLGDGSTNGYIVMNGDTANNIGGTITADSDIYIYSGSYISADAKGFTGNAGPGGGNASNAAGHGGMGGGASGGDTYDSAVAPVMLGSSGENNAGGGAIKLNIAGNLTNAGSIRANSTADGGAGGSVWINFTGGASAWAGGGSIAADVTGSGGGGRVAVTGYVTDTHSGTTTAYDSWGWGNVGGTGTVYLKSAAQTYGTLIIDSNNPTIPANAGKYAKTNVTPLTLDSLVVRNKGTFLVPNGSTLTFAASSTLTGTSNSDFTNAGVLDVSASGITLAGPILTNTGTLTTGATFSLGLNLVQRGTWNATSTDLTVASGGTFTADVATTLNSLTVQSGGNVNHSDNSTAETYKMDITAVNVTVNSGGTINVNGLGFDSGYGSGAGNATNAAGYGGMGGGASGGDTYGSLTAPVNLGSGGEGVSGGGAIKLTITGNFANSGTISANGAANDGGSGGSVWINMTGGSSAWSGTSGSITANASGSGGGGRIAITGFVTDTHTGTTLATYNSGWGKNGASGTIYTKSTAQTYGTLSVDSSNPSTTPNSGKYTKSNVTNLTLDSLNVQNKGTFVIPSGATLTIASGGSMSGTSNAALDILTGGTFDTSAIATVTGPTITNTGTLTTKSTWTLSTSLVQRGTITSSTNLTIASGGVLTSDVAGNTYGNMIIQSGGNLTHSSNTTAETYKVDINVTNLTIDSGGTVNVTAKGFAPNYGAGTPPACVAGVTAGYGGMGAGATGGDTYGSAIAPVNLGSGGRTSGNDSSGGGAVKINVAGNFANSGSITSGTPANGTCGGGGSTSGSGGSVWINFTGAGTWSGTSGTISADGGSGGGGRVAVTGYATDSRSGGSVTATGYAAGTVYLKSTAQTYGSLIVDNGNATVQAGKYTKTNISPLTLDTVVVQNKGVYLVPAGSTLTATGSKTIATNSILRNQGTLAGETDSITGTLIADGVQTLGDVTINSGGKITHTTNTTAETYKTTITANSMTINSGGSIDVAGLGYSGGSAGANGSGTGYGGLGGATSSGGGGGYGGLGGAGQGANAGTAGATYGSAADPVNIGSGGGGGASAAGGSGGGAVILNVTTNLTNAGTITANGTAGTAGTHGGAGGSGGTVSLTVGGNFNCTGGVVTANGGAGAGTTTKGGGGGGGRILRNVTGTYTACTTFTATGGAGGGNSGGAGTTSVPPTAPTIGAASSVTTSSITWNWTDASTTEIQFIVHDGSENVIATVNSTTTAGTGTTYNTPESSLTPNTNYTRHVHAYDGTLTSAASSTASAYTLANAPTVPALSAQTTTGMVATVATNSNPAGTQYAIHETSTNNYVQADGTLGASAVWQTYTNWGGASGQTVSGLSVNTNYTFEVKARNADSVETAYSPTASSYTLANAPGAPTLSSAAATTLKVVLNQNSNPSNTTYAIYDNTDSKYVQADGTLGASAVWQTYTNWGGASGQTVSGLTPNTSHTLKAKARNGNNTETAFSSDSSALVTLTNVPGTPTLSTATTTGLTVTLNENSNPSSVTYAIYDNTDSKYVQADGTLGASAVWQTYTNWGGASGQTVSGLSVNTNYTFEVKARNADSIETAYSATASKATLSVVPTIASGETVSTSSVKITFGTDTNPDDTEYAVFESNTNKYLQADGTLGDSIIWLVKTVLSGASGNTVTGLDSGSTFIFSSKTKNRDGVETAYSATVSTVTDSVIKPVPTGPMPPVTVTAPSATSTTSSSPTPTPTATTTSTTSTSPSPTDTSTSTISPSPTATTTSGGDEEPCTDPGLLEQLFGNGNSYHCENGNHVDDPPPPPPPCLIFCGVGLKVHFLPPGGEYDEPTTVTIFHTPKSHTAQIRYTLDGSEPNIYSPLYTEPVYVPASVKIKAKAYGSESPTETADFIINQPAAGINTNGDGDTPQLSITSDPAKPQLSNNLYLSPLSITITAPDNTKVYYTLTGGKPVIESTPYSGPFNITRSAIITAIAVDGDKVVATGQRQFSLATEPATVTQTTLDRLANPGGSSALIAAGLAVSFWAGILQLILAWFQYFLRLLLLLPALLFGRKKKLNLVGKTVRGGMGDAFSFVILTLKDKYGKTIQTTLSDKKGRFGFTARAGKYTISVLKPGYGIYNNLHVGNYHGELLDVSEENNENLIIVLDSVLNTKTEGATSARLHLLLNFSQSILLVAGFLFSALIFLHAVTILHGIILAFYTLALLIPLFSLFTKYLYPLTSASD